ncbi:MAG: GspH/FimT family pseudopilin [Gammaproteobacteria bacterium]
MVVPSNIGTTLLEAIIVLLLISILLIIAVPIGRDYIARSHVTTATYQIVNALNMGRVSAIERGMSVTFCHSNDGIDCNGDWSEGQILFFDQQGNGRVDTGDEVIRVWQADKFAVQINWRGFFSNRIIQMDPSGMGKAMSGSFIICPISGKSQYARAIIVSRNGRARISKVDSQGGALQCTA